jgi:hypothetical protein
MLGLLEPKEIDIDGKLFTISKFPAVAGREIIAKYPLSGLPKIGEYKLNEETMFKLMSYVATASGLRLTTPELINNHAGDWETLARIELAMMEYNCSFFRDGRISTFLNDIAQKIPQLIFKMLTDLSARSSQTEKQP